VECAVSVGGTCQEFEERKKERERRKKRRACGEGGGLGEVGRVEAGDDALGTGKGADDGVDTDTGVHEAVDGIVSLLKDSSERRNGLGAVGPGLLQEAEAVADVGLVGDCIVTY
jgi:hypothetical protein